ncbi:MAG: hypothetical protein RR461_08295 [Angelakisella sp.]
MAKSKERLDAEASHPMTPKERLLNFWFYYKWWVLGGVVALIMLLVFIRDVRSNVKPDYTIGLLTSYVMPEETVQALETAILPYANDRNGDGKTVVYLSPYSIPVNGAAPADPMAHAANMTRLSGDIQMGDSMLFITDNVVEYQKLLELFCYNDGTEPPLEGEPDATKLGVPFAECPPLSGLDTSKASPGTFTLVKRTVAPSVLEKKQEMAGYYQDSMNLFDALTTN